MRYRELIEARRPWKTYRGRKHRCLIASPEDLGNGKCVVTEAEVQFGSIYTGRSEVFWGVYVKIINPFGGEEWLGEDRKWLLDALEQASEAAKQCGWEVLAVGRSPQFKETGLSANSGYGIHPAYPDRHVQMFEPPPRKMQEE